MCEHEQTGESEKSESVLKKRKCKRRETERKRLMKGMNVREKESVEVGGEEENVLSLGVCGCVGVWINEL